MQQDDQVITLVVGDPVWYLMGGAIDFVAIKDSLIIRVSQADLEIAPVVGTISRAFMAQMTETIEHLQNNHKNSTK